MCFPLQMYVDIQKQTNLMLISEFVFRILINLYDLSALFTWVYADVCSYVSVMTKVGIFISDVIKLHYQWIMSLSVPLTFDG